MADNKKEYTVVVSDFHVPFHSDWAIRMFREYVRDHPDLKENTKTIVFNGDVLDFYTISHFKKNPDNRITSKEEIKVAENGIERIRSYFPNHDRVVFIEGNHEFRLQTYAWTKAPDLWGIVPHNTYGVLHLLQHGVAETDFYEYGDFPNKVYYDKGKVLIAHTFSESVSSYSGYTASNILRKHGCDAIIGHTHRLAKVYHRNFKRQLVGVEGGSFCSLNPEYARQPNWQNGFTYIEWDGMSYKIQIVRL